MINVGKLFIIAGIILVILGVIFIFGPKIPFIGRLPGDILIKRENFTFYLPLTTSIIISLLISLLFYLFRK